MHKGAAYDCIVVTGGSISKHILDARHKSRFLILLAWGFQSIPSNGESNESHYYLFCDTVY